MRITQGEYGGTFYLNWKQEGTEDPQVLTGYTVTGVMNPEPGPGGTPIAITGTLTVDNGPLGRVAFTPAQADTTTAGQFSIILSAVLGAIRLRSYPFPLDIMPYTP